MDEVYVIKVKGKEYSDFTEVGTFATWHYSPEDLCQIINDVYDAISKYEYLGYEVRVYPDFVCH